MKFKIENIVSGKDIEYCVGPNCGKATEYLITTPISERENYVEGAGQLCKSCSQSIYGGRNG